MSSRRGSREEVDALVLDFLDWWENRAPLDSFEGPLNTESHRWERGRSKIRMTYLLDLYRRGLIEVPSAPPPGLPQALLFVQHRCE